jgi:hypothetical protein
MDLQTALRAASLPSLDFAYRYLFMRSEALEAEHRETCNLLRAVRDMIDGERDRRVDDERAAKEAARATLAGVLDGRTAGNRRHKMDTGGK